jgi:uncharacterized protein with HEPN domain
MQRDDAYLLDMLIYARKARDYCENSGFDDFLQNDLLQSATLHVLQIIGEAANKVSKEYRVSHTEIPWDQIINLRHRLVHEYPRIEFPKIWDIVQNQLPPLITVLEKLVPPEWVYFHPKV